MKMPGPYVPLDVHYASDADIRRAGEAAELLFVRGLTYAKARFTDGFIPDYDLEVVGAGLKGLRARAAKLVEHGLWEVVDGGWQVRSWSRWNETSEELAGKRERAAARQRAKRERDTTVTEGPVTRPSQRDKPVTHAPVTRESHPLSKRQDKTETSKPPAGAAGAASRVTALGLPVETTTAQTIVGEWIDRCAKRPPSDVIGPVGKRVAKMLEEGTDPDDIRRGMAAWHAKGLNPSSLPSVVNEVMNRSPTGPHRESTTDARVNAALEIAQQFAAEEADQPPALEGRPA